MLTTTTLSALLLTLTTAITAAPQKTGPPLAGVKVCTGPNYTGECWTLSASPFNECQTLVPLFYKNVGSFKPDEKVLCRITYTADTCTPHGDAFVDSAGAPDLHAFETVSGEVVDAGSQITSFLCQQCDNC